MSRLSFRPADIAADRGSLLEFALDLFATSFDDPDWFARRFGADGDGYTAWLATVTGGVADFLAVVEWEGVPAGLVVLGPEPGRPNIGHIYHYYLRPDARGLGLGAELNRHALATLLRHGFGVARLHVAPGNASAIRFYARLGWTAAGDVPGKDVVAMETPAGGADPGGADAD